MPYDWNYIEANNYRTLQRSKAPFVYCKTIGQQYEPWRPACDFSLFLDPEKNKDHIPAKAKIVWKWRHWQIYLQRCCHSKKFSWTWLHQRPARAHQGVCNTLLIIIIPSRKIKKNRKWSRADKNLSQAALEASWSGLAEKLGEGEKAKVAQAFYISFCLTSIVSEFCKRHFHYLYFPQAGKLQPALFNLYRQARQAERFNIFRFTINFLY